MKKIIVTILIVSLFFIEGCTAIGYTVGKGIHTKQSLEIEKIESVEVGTWLTISMKNDEVIKGQFISCVNDTLLVTFKTTTNLNAPISDSQFLSILNDKALYKIPVGQIEEIKVSKADFRGVGTLLGIVVDLFSFMIILILINHKSSFYYVR